MREGEDYRLLLADLPPTVRGLIVVDASGFPTIVINARLSDAERRKALRHELDHWMRGDPDSAETIRHAEGRPEVALEAMDGSPLAVPAPIAPDDLARIDVGLYRPRTAAARAVVLDALAELRRACRDALDAAGARDADVPPAGPEDLRWIGISADGVAHLRVEAPDLRATVYLHDGCTADLTVLGRSFTVVATAAGPQRVWETTGGAWVTRFAGWGRRRVPA